MLIGLLPLQSGNIVWNNQTVENVTEFFVPPVCAYISQTPNLFSESLKNNILLGNKEEENNLQNAIYNSVLDEHIVQFDNGLDTLIGSQGVKLSGGQRKRVAAARMFACDAELMIIDDISSGLDQETENLLWNRMLENKEFTCIIASNSKQILRRADQIILMDEGKIVDQGNLEELLCRNDVIKENFKD